MLAHDDGLPPRWHLAFEGPMAAGKTTHAQLYATATGAQVVLEDFAHNEFLADFYAERGRWALPMQLTFLLSRYEQFGKVDATATRVVADHTLKKDAMFARMLLRGRELRLYEEVRLNLPTETATPTHVVYLDAPNNVLLARIRTRNRLYEAAIAEGYLDEVRQAYEDEFASRPNQRVLRIGTGEVSLDSASEMNAIHRRISTWIRVTSLSGFAEGL